MDEVKNARNSKIVVDDKGRVNNKDVGENKKVASNVIRNSSFELLRIIAMLMIIGHHFVVHGGFLDASTVNSWILTFLEFGGKFGVIIYLLISGYFMVTSKFTFRKLFKLWCQVWFYSVVLYVVSIFLPNFHFSARGLVVALLPVLMVEWWFVTYYIFLYLLSPFINKLVKVLSKSEYGWLIVLLLFLYTALRLSIGISSIFLMFIIIYLIGGYLRLHPIKKMQKFSILVPCFIMLYLALNIAQYYLNYHFFETDRLPMILCAVLLFMIFEKLNIKSKTINIISSATFGVYLIHDNLNISPYLWNEVFQNNSYGYSEYLLLYAFLVIVSVFVICAIIDLARKYLLERPLFKIVDKSCEKYRLKHKNSEIDNTKQITNN